MPNTSDSDESACDSEFSCDGLLAELRDAASRRGVVFAPCRKGSLPPSSGRASNPPEGGAGDCLDSTRRLLRSLRYYGVEPESVAVFDARDGPDRTDRSSEL